MRIEPLEDQPVDEQGMEQFLEYFYGRPLAPPRDMIAEQTEPELVDREVRVEDVVHINIQLTPVDVELEEAPDLTEPEVNEDYLLQLEADMKAEDDENWWNAFVYGVAAGVGSSIVAAIALAAVWSIK